MAYTALTAFLDRNKIPPEGVVVTLVLGGGCPLDCGFCLLKQRRENLKEPVLLVNHYVAILRWLFRENMLGGVALVGEEPLQVNVWPVARRILRLSEDLGVPTALVTNGYNLWYFSRELAHFNKTKIMVSVDAVGEKHDQLRQTEGAFARIDGGLCQIDPVQRKNVFIATTLLGENIGDIPAVLDLAKERNIDHVSLSPLLTSSEQGPMKVDRTVMWRAMEAIPGYLERAKESGVSLHLSDEFSLLGPWEERLRGIGIDIAAPAKPGRLIRIDAHGRIENLRTLRDGGTLDVTLPHEVDEVESMLEASEGVLFG